VRSRSEGRPEEIEAGFGGTSSSLAFFFLRVCGESLALPHAAVSDLTLCRSAVLVVRARPLFSKSLTAVADCREIFVIPAHAYGFSSIVKQKKKAKICFVIYIAGLFF